MAKSLPNGTLLSTLERGKLLRHQTAVEAFIADHWQPQFPARWQEALLQCGWHLSRWPVALGGPGWDRQQCWLWERALARAGAEAGDPLTLNGIGVLLCALQAQTSDAHVEAALAGIRAMQARWLWLDPRVDAQASCRLREGAAVLDYHSSYLPSVENATDLLLCLELPTATQSPCLCWIPADHPAVRRKAHRPLGEAAVPGTLPGELTITRFPMNEGRILGRGAAARTALAQAVAGLTQLQAGAIGSGALERLVTALQETVALDEDLERALAEARVALLGLEGLERRLAQLEPTGSEFPPLELLRRQRGTQLRQQLDALAVQALGYYLLPAEDPPQGVNEPAVGPPRARELVIAALRGRGLSVVDEGELLRLDQLARMLGLPGADLVPGLAGRPSPGPGEEG